MAQVLACGVASGRATRPPPSSTARTSRPDRDNVVGARTGAVDWLPDSSVDAFPRRGPGTFPADAAHLSAELKIPNQPLDRGHEIAGMSRPRQETRRPVLNDLGWPAAVADDGRKARRHRVQYAIAKLIGGAGQDERIGGRVGCSKIDVVQ